MGKITIKNMSTLTETAALLRVVAFIISDMVTALHGDNIENDIKIEHIQKVLELMNTLLVILK